jgi:hypothetical protein
MEEFKLTNDMVNGFFEIVGACFIFMNVRQILKDKSVKGVYWPATAFFSAWGMWNLYYYPSLNQWWSFTGGVFIVIFNTAWIGLTIYYLYVNPPKDTQKG